MDGYVFLVNDHAFALSRQIEIEIRNTLPTFLGPNFTPESQQKGMLVSLVNLLAVDIDDDNGAQELCRVSVNLWITI